MSEAKLSAPAALCSAEGYEERARARGRCNLHYQRWLTTKEGRGTVRRYKSRKQLKLPENELDFAYLAGLIHGDGCITRHNPVRGYWRVTIATNDVGIIDWLDGIGGA